MSTFKEYPKYDAIGLAELVRNREISTNELIDEAITRIEKANPLLNAVVTKLYDEVKKEIDLGLPDGPFKGVPFLLKESEQYAGAPITFSSRYIVENNCEYDSEIVSRYKNSGLAIRFVRYDRISIVWPLSQSLGYKSKSRWVKWRHCLCYCLWDGTDSTRK